MGVPPDVGREKIQFLQFLRFDGRVSHEFSAGEPKNVTPTRFILRLASEVCWYDADVALGCTLLALALLPPPQVGSSFDVADVVRKLLRGRSVDGASTSSAIRLQDDAGSRRIALFRFVEDGTGGLLLTIELVSQREPLFPHTLRLNLGDAPSLQLRILDLQERAEDDSELVLAPVSREQLDRIADATSLQVTLQGWDETFRGSIEDKGLKRIRAFRERQRSDS